tara:strand:+ start:1266 stop:2294 length:1029 start_codon:yes stop_codon:yes gene_type:complete
MDSRFSKLSFIVFSVALFILVGLWVESGRSDPTDTVIETATTTKEVTTSTEPELPSFLATFFPDTDFTDADPSIYKLISGGPPKDGIPSIDEPEFVTLNAFKRSDDVLAVVLEGDGITKVYPYNILTWHEIVNDEIDGKPVSVTFCPLCGSAIVYDRRLPAGETTFGVSGGLIESNMVMYDRMTESLWQQSTGEALAGVYRGETLSLVPFQLLTMSEIKDKYPKAQVLSENTGYSRDYGRNPYSGYDEDNERFVFNISGFSTAYDAKEIMVVFRVDGTPVATPWLELAEGEVKAAEVNGKDITITKTDGELTVEDPDGQIIPFYFEMWFSFALQHGENASVI